MRKLRTRQHIIEDLGFNHIEKQILLAGYVMRRYNQNDYGYDGCIDTFNDIGEVENLSMMFQLKSTDNIHLAQQKDGFVFDLSIRDLELWLRDIRPVLLFLHDAQADRTYFIDLQAYFQKNRQLLKKVRKFVRVYFAQDAYLNNNAIKEFRTFYKNNR